MADAAFEDGEELPLYLKVLDEGSVQVLSALAQDAVFPITEMKWDRKAREFAVLLNRFRWEDKEAAEARGRAYERVQSVLLISDVLKVASHGIDLSDRETVLSLLSITWQGGEDGMGRLELTLAGDGAVAVDVEVLDLVLKDVTRPYKAPSGKAPEHRD